tara:strand:+ start:238 stop:420 length:183 start_codon:yes stop_codon:yes gene_type:complete
MDVVITPDDTMTNFLGWPTKKIIEEVARQLGGKITYLNTLNSQGVSSKKIVIEYDVEEKV